MKHVASVLPFIEHAAVLSEFRCPCCHCKTLGERVGFEICEVCFWEDDGQDDNDADIVRGGCNSSLSLTTARENYLRFGACEARMVPHVRQPRPEELPD